MGMTETLHKKITEAFCPTTLKITDESHKHVGHAGYQEGGESHFHLVIVTEDFEGKSRVARHKMVNQLLAEELRTSIHALSLTLLTPTEMESH